MAASRARTAGQRADDLGSLVILPGGEVGTLVEWWNAPDGSEWRWRLEFYNRR